MNKKQNKNTTHSNFITKYITNWSEYNRALILRGDISLLLPGRKENHIYDPKHIPTPSANDYRIMDEINVCITSSHSVGHPKKYSDELIMSILAIREVFQLPLRQTVGFIAFLYGSISLIYLLPDYSTLSRRMKKLEVDFTKRFTKDKDSGEYESIIDNNDEDGITLLVDSSGFKISGEGEWRVRKHGKTKRRDWTETHLGINHKKRDILALINTTAHVHDITQLEPLLHECKKRGVKVKMVIADGAYDAKKAYDLAKKFDFELVVPPRENAVEHLNSYHYQVYDTPGWEERNRVIRHIDEYGLDGWMADTDYHRRSLVENTFFRLKTIFSPSLKSKTKENQYTEQCLRAKLLNHFNSLGLPKYEYHYPNQNQTKQPVATPA